MFTARMQEAAKSGNPESIVAFSNGIATNGWSWTPAADYFDGDTPQPIGFTPSGRRLGPTGEQHHMLSYLGVRWGNGTQPPRFNDTELAGYAKAATSGECFLRHFLNTKQQTSALLPPVSCLTMKP